MIRSKWFIRRNSKTIILRSFYFLLALTILISLTTSLLSIGIGEEWTQKIVGKWSVSILNKVQDLNYISKDTRNEQTLRSFYENKLQTLEMPTIVETSEPKSPSTVRVNLDRLNHEPLGSFPSSLNDKRANHSNELSIDDKNEGSKTKETVRVPGQLDPVLEYKLKVLCKKLNLPFNSTELLTLSPPLNFDLMLQRFSLVKSQREELQSNIEFNDAEFDVKARKDRVSNYCKHYHMGKYRRSTMNDLSFPEMRGIYRPYWFLFRERELAWCPVYKAGSSSMFHNFLRLGGYSEDDLKLRTEPYIKLAKRLLGTPSPDNLLSEKSVRILVVRHPFERLLSSYRDKLEDSTVRLEDGTLTFYNNYGRKIVEKYRVDHTILRIEPTWEEFVRYILDTVSMKYDDHWRPIFEACSPCQVDFDIIAKVETFSRDQAYFIRKLGLGDVLKIPAWSHRISEEKQEGVAEEYFGQLTKQQIRDLCAKYLMDFVLFGYSPDEYIPYGREELNGI